jgi:hypothetical protein
MPSESWLPTSCALLDAWHLVAYECCWHVLTAFSYYRTCSVLIFSTDSLTIGCCRYGEAGLVQGYPATGPSNGVQMSHIPPGK